MACATAAPAAITTAHSSSPPPQAIPSLSLALSLSLSLSQSITHTLEQGVQLKAALAFPPIPALHPPLRTRKEPRPDRCSMADGESEARVPVTVRGCGCHRPPWTTPIPSSHAQGPGAWQVCLYDLSRGMMRAMSPQLLGRWGGWGEKGSDRGWPRRHRLTRIEGLREAAGRPLAQLGSGLR